jgi:hypothetical protein
MKMAGCLPRPGTGRFDQPHDAAHSGGDALDSVLRGGGSRGAANAASRGAARGRGARRCRMRRRAPFTLMSPPQRTASRVSRCSGSGRAGCTTSFLLSSRHDGSRYPRAGVVPPGPEANVNKEHVADSFFQLIAKTDQRCRHLIGSAPGDPLMSGIFDVFYEISHTFIRDYFRSISWLGVNFLECFR